MRFLHCCLFVLGALVLPAAEIEPSAENEIRRLDQKWGEAVAKHDASLVTSLYAEDAIVLDPGAPAHRGATEMRALWTELVKTPGLRIGIIPEKITVTGELALDFGRFELETENQGKRTTQVNKYLTIWRRISGDWRVIYDAWNTNEPTAP